MQSHCKCLVLKVFSVSYLANPFLHLLSLFIVFCLWLRMCNLACTLQVPIHVHYLITVHCNYIIIYKI